MANNDDISTQLALTVKLAAAVDKMVVSNERLESSYETQSKTLADVLNSTTQLNQQSTKFWASLAADADKAGKSNENLGDQLNKMIKTYGLVNKGTDEMGNKLLKTAKKTTIAGAAITGFYQGLRNVMAVGKGVFGALTTVASTIFNVGAAIVAIPFKLFTRFIDMAAGAGGGMSELAEAVRKMRMEFGSLAGPTNKSIIEVAKSMTNFNQTGLSTFRVFGMFPARLEYLIELAKEMGPTFNKFTDEFRKNGGALLAYQKGLGLSGEAFAAFGNFAVANGKKIADVLKDTTKYSYELGNAFGIDAKLISKDMGKAMIDVKHFAGATVKSIAEASVYSRKLGIELDKITGTLDAFETFDTAAENAAKLSQSFGVTVDAFKLMEAQDPATQVDQLRKAFAQAGKSTENMTRQELKLLAQTTGLDEATAKLAFSSRNQGISMDEVKKKGGDAAAKTLTQAEAMKKLADAIERLVMSGMTQKGGFFDQFINGMFRGLQSTKEFRHAVWNVKIGLQQTMYEGVKFGRELMKAMPGLHNFVQGLADIFQPKKFRQFAANVRIELIKFVKDLTNPGSSASFSNLMTNMRKHFFDFFDQTTPGGMKMLNGFKTMFKALVKGVSQGIVWVSDKIADGIKWLVDVIQHPEKLVGMIKGGAGAGASFVMQTVAPLVDALIHAFHAIEPRLEELLGLVFNKIKDVVKQHLGGLTEIGGSVLFAMFAPAAMRGVITAVSASLTTTLFKSIGSSIGSAGSYLSTTMPTFTAIGKILGGWLGAAAGPVMIAGLAVIAYKEGKALIDKAFGEQRANVAAIQSADFAATNLLGKNTNIDDKKKGVEKLKKQIDDMTHNMTHKGFFAGILTNSDEEFVHIQELTKVYEKLQSEVITGVGKKSEAEAMKQRAKGVDFLGATSVEDAQAKIDALQKLSKKVMGKDFNIDKTLSDVRAKFATVNFNVISAEQSGQLDASTKSLGQVSDMVKVAGDTISTLAGLANVKDIKLPTNLVSNVSNVVFSLGGILTSLNANVDSAQVLQSVKDRLSGVSGLFNNLQDVEKAASEIKMMGIKPALVAVESMIKSVNALDDMLSDAKLNKVNITAKLANVAKAVGFGTSGKYVITNKAVNLVVNLTVTMSADEIEQSMILRANSTIRQRLDALAKEDNMGPQMMPNATYTPAAGSPPALGKDFAK